MTNVDIFEISSEMVLDRQDHRFGQVWYFVSWLPVADDDDAIGVIWWDGMTYEAARAACAELALDYGGKIKIVDRVSS